MKSTFNRESNVLYPNWHRMSKTELTPQNSHFSVQPAYCPTPFGVGAVLKLAHSAEFTMNMVELAQDML